MCEQGFVLQLIRLPQTKPGTIVAVCADCYALGASLLGIGSKYTQGEGRRKWRIPIYFVQVRKRAVKSHVCKARMGSKLVRRMRLSEIACVVKALLGQGVAFTKSDAGCRSLRRKRRFSRRETRKGNASFLRPKFILSGRKH